MCSSGSIDHSCCAILTGAASCGSTWKTVGVSTAATCTNSHPTRTRRMSTAPHRAVPMFRSHYPASPLAQAFQELRQRAVVRHDGGDLDVLLRTVLSITTDAERDRKSVV